MKNNLLNTLKKYYIPVFFGILILCGLIYRANGGAPSSTSSSSISNDEHTCGYCNASFSGYGWSTVGGEQFQQTSWSGYGYCSKKCAYDSQPKRWK